MSLRRWVSGLLSFGVTAGLVGVLVHTNGWSLGELPTVTLIFALAAVGLAMAALRNGWPLFLTGVASLLFLASLPLVPERRWVLTLAASAVVLLLTRLSGLGWISQWGAKGLGAAGGVAAVWALISRSQGGWATELAFGGPWTFIGLTVAIAVLGLFPRQADDE